jgi:hypothetical protein
MGLPDITALVACVAGAGGAVVQFIYLGHGRARKVMMAPAGIFVRIALLVATSGLQLTGGPWAYIAAAWAIIAWEIAVQATARVRRRASRAS